MTTEQDIKDKIERDIEYLEQEFPKGKTKFRGQSMVLLTLARIQGSKSKQKEMLDFLEDLSKEYWNKHFSMVINKIDNKIKELKERMK